ncbi:DNA polymerase III subunit gamma and tau, partial [Streptomyces sp. NPDC057654]
APGGAGGRTGRSAPAPAPAPARRPGGWPSAAAPGQGVPQAAPAPGPAAPAAAPQQPQAAAAPQPGQGAAQVQRMWPEILEAVKNRRRFTWILLSQNAQIAGFDGSTLQIGFSNAGARDSFAGGGSEEVLKQALADALNVQWKIDLVVDSSGGTNPPGGAVGGGGSAFGNVGYVNPGHAPAAPPRPAAAPAPAESAPAPAPYNSSYSGGSGGSSGSGGNSGGDGGGGAQAARQAVHTPPAAPQAHASQAQQAPAPAPAEPSGGYQAPEPPPRVSIEDDMPEEDDPDLVDSALTGHDLIVRELGATVIEEIANE